MTHPPSQPARGTQRGKATRSKAKALAAVAAAATAQQQAAHVDPRLWWQQLLAEEAELQQLEQVMTVTNLRWSHGFWTLLHDRSERLCRDMAACIDLMGAQR